MHSDRFGVQRQSQQQWSTGLSYPYHSVSFLFYCVRLRNDPHSPEEFRVNGAVSNSEEFQKAFECKVGAKMNPTNKCIIW